MDNIEHLGLTDEKRKRGRPSKAANERFHRLKLIRQSQLDQAKRGSLEEASELNRSISSFMWNFPNLIDSLASSSGSSRTGDSEFKICSCGRIYPPTYLYSHCFCGEFFSR
ncbi:uncharacterized protein LOC122512732 [Leptopilina heterotoma]|uniref:uncharacterized protein LOC122512732 n=1 Tax=Leptopilina heterotoma TaxID=63436 RepID=UPI001CA7BE5C|nr:uncharacterized protein LOC122512732 [Leptopilina heterotoma]